MATPSSASSRESNSTTAVDSSAAARNARAEQAKLEALAGHPIEAHDWPYWSEKVRAAETAKTMKKALKGLSDKERQAVETVTKGIINKLLHSPMAYLRSDSKGDKATVSQIEEIFGLRD